MSTEINWVKFRQYRWIHSRHHCSKMASKLSWDDMQSHEKNLDLWPRIQPSRNDWSCLDKKNKKNTTARCPTNMYIFLLTLMLLAFTMRRMVRSAHLALWLSPIRFTDHVNFTFSDRYSYEKIHTASLGAARWTDLSTRSSPHQAIA